MRGVASSGRPAVSPSLNRAVLGRFDGLPDGAAGQQANAWLTSWAVARRMAERPELLLAAAAMDPPLPPVPDSADLAADLLLAAAPWPRRLDALVGEGHPGAVALADDLGRVLGGLVATLVTGPGDARAARPDWPAQRWESWSRVRRLSLGGGLLSGSLGRRMVARAAELASASGASTSLTLVADPVGLALRGAASLLSSGGIAVDAGGTTVKSAQVRMSELVPLPPRSAPTRRDAGDVVGVLADVVGCGLERSDFRPLEPIPVAVALATYVDADGQPYPGQLGPYAPLGDVDLIPALRDAIASRFGPTVELTVVHDGAAALLGARLDDVDADAAIVLGTAIGSGLDPRR